MGDKGGKKDKEKGQKQNTVKQKQKSKEEYRICQNYIKIN